MVSRKSTRPSKYCNPSDEVPIDPVYCPEVVADYCSHGSDVGRKSRTTAVRKHLSSIGWKFYYAPIKAGTKRELKYCSPAGRVFHTLITACQSCLHEHPAEPIPILDRGIKRKLLPSQSPSSESGKRIQTDEVAAIDLKEVSDGDWSSASCDSASSGTTSSEESSRVTIDGLAAMLRAFQEEQAVVEEVQFIDQRHIWWMDELFLNLQRSSC